jgi:heme/copper-type cytochrome/quinol oxidase subunit 2
MSVLTTAAHGARPAAARWQTNWRLAFLPLLATVILLLPAPSAASPGDRTVRIMASSFQYAPAIVRVQPGDRVTLELVSTDVVHGLYLDGYDLRVSADPGQTARLTFVADRTGTFRFRCSVTCGPMHPFMIGKLVVGTNWLAWRAVGLAILVAAAGLLGVRR